MRGGSCIISPFGQVLAGPNYEEECILTADIDLGEIMRGKYDLDVVGHYARPDVFRLYVNEALDAKSGYGPVPMTTMKKWSKDAKFEIPLGLFSPERSGVMARVDK